MSLTQIIPYKSLYLKSPPIEITDIPPQSDSIFTLEPEVLVDLALHTLQAKGLQLIEWGSELYRRMHVPVIAMHFSYIIPDNDLDAASSILANTGLPRSPPPDLLLKTSGDFYAKGRLHRLTRSESLGSVQYLILFPLSFSSFSASELTLAPRLTSLTSPQCKTVLVPRPSAVYASILRTMLAYPPICPTRGVLESDLSELIGYNLYDLQCGYVNIDDEELCEDLQVDQRIDDAVQHVQGWGWNCEWRMGEEWMGDALCAVVKGSGEIEHLPCAQQQGF